MLYDEITGHEYIKSILQNAVKYMREAHAYLFYGPPGVGKKKTAGAFAQALTCSAPIEGKACGECLSCRKVLSGNHPDIHYIKPAGASLKIDQVRALQKEVQLKPYEGRNKVFIITQAETMTGEAANSILKTLEEPPEATVFILVAENPYTLLPTILSRCQQIAFNKVPAGQISELLIGKYQKSSQEANLLAALSDGQVGRAIELAEKDNILQQRDYAAGLAELARDGNYLDFYCASEELENNKKEIMTILDFMSACYRDILVWQETKDAGLLVNLDKREEFGRYNYSSTKLLDIIALIEDVRKKITANVNFRLAVEVLLLSINRG